MLLSAALVVVVAVAVACAAETESEVPRRKFTAEEIEAVRAEAAKHAANGERELEVEESSANASKKPEPVSKERSLKCSACEIFVSKLRAGIQSVSKTRMMRKGHRFDTTSTHEPGNRKLIPYARSETHIMVLIDRICESLERDGYKAAILLKGRWYYATEKMKDKAEKFFTTGEERKTFRKYCDKLAQRDDELMELLVRRDSEGYDPSVYDDVLRKKICEEIETHCVGVVDDPDAYAGHVPNFFIKEEGDEEL